MRLYAATLQMPAGFPAIGVMCLRHSSDSHRRSRVLSFVTCLSHERAASDSPSRIEWQGEHGGIVNLRTSVKIAAVVSGVAPMSGREGVGELWSMRSTRPSLAETAGLVSFAAPSTRWSPTRSPRRSGHVAPGSVPGASFAERTIAYFSERPTSDGRARRQNSR